MTWRICGIQFNEYVQSERSSLGDFTAPINARFTIGSSAHGTCIASRTNEFSAENNAVVWPTRIGASLHRVAFVFLASVTAGRVTTEPFERSLTVARRSQ